MEICSVFPKMMIVCQFGKVAVFISKEVDSRSLCFRKLPDVGGYNEALTLKSARIFVGGQRLVLLRTHPRESALMRKGNEGA